MRKIFTLCITLFFTLNHLAQAPLRTCLYEEFASENGPWYPTDPTVNSTIASNSTAIIPIKWMIGLPSAPTATWSFFQTDKAEINWRYRSSSGSTLAAGPSTLAYGYPSQMTPTATVVNGINTAPTGLIDGQHQWSFGAASDDPMDLTATSIANAQSVFTNFRLTMTPNWNSNFTNCQVAVSVQSTITFTSLGALMFRLCLVEREIHYTAAPGLNSQIDFYDVVRKSYPTSTSGTSVTAMGTPLYTVWAAGQTQTFVVNCNIPTYIHDLSQMAFVGFVQDDGDRKIYQAARSAQPAIPNDVYAAAINVPVSCTGAFTPSFVAQNLGTGAITSLTIAPALDGVAQPTFTYNGSISGGATATITLPSYTAAYGSHTMAVNVTGVSGGDMNTVNNNTRKTFGVSNLTVPGVQEGFTSFPPQNWYVLNYNFTPGTWVAGSPGGFGTSTGSAKYDFYNCVYGGSVDDLFMPALNLSGVSNPVLTFDVAYAQWTNQNDKLEVMVSTDCGATWSNVYSKQGSVLATAPSHSTSAFAPAATQWRTETVALPTASNQPFVLVKYVATPDFGNNLYIDNVNIGQPTSVSKNEKLIMTCLVYPNPADVLVTLSITMPSDDNADVALVNALGQTVYTVKSKKLLVGANKLAIPTESLPEGIYFVTLVTSTQSLSSKLYIKR